MTPAEEAVAIVDEQNRVVGAAPRREVRQQRLPHRSTYILVFNAGGELFVQKRTVTKDVYPGFYDAVAGGVVLAEESYEECARRELAEELGIRDTPLEGLFDFFFEDDRCRVWGRAFRCVYNGEMILQAEEIESGEFLPVGDVLRRADSESFTPDGMYVLRRYMQETCQPIAAR